MNRIILSQSPPHDRLPFGVSLEEGLKKAIFEKLGKDIAVNYKTSIIVKVYHNQELISHMNALVFEINISTLELPFTSRNGVAFLDNLQNANYIQGLENLVAIVENGSSKREVILKY